jgi:hypothetical protein
MSIWSGQFVSTRLSKWLKGAAMKISERTIKRLGQIITGDKSLSPYRSGPKLIEFFNEFGMDMTYGPGFPSRWSFAEDCLRKFNDTPHLQKIILATLDPRDFMGAMVSDPETRLPKPANIQDAVTYLNEFLAYDGFAIVPRGNGYAMIDRSRGEITVDVKLAPGHLSNEFITEQIEKCRTKSVDGDYDGAITNARSLVEAVLSAIEKEVEPSPPEYDGDLQKLYKRVQKQLNLSPENPKISQSLKQTLSGFISIICGISGLSNKMRTGILKAISKQIGTIFR